MKTSERALARLLARTACGLALGVGLVATAVAPAAARQGGPDHAAMFERMDADGSGGVTLEEVRQNFMARFDEADADKDGSVSREEFDAAREKMREARAERGDHGGEHAGRKGDRDGHGKGPRAGRDGGADRSALMAARIMGRVDANQSGGLDPDEFAALGERMQERDPDRPAPEFGMLDGNGDGVIDEQELGQEIARHMADRRGGPRHDGDRPMRKGEARPGDRADRFFDRLDADEDGAVSRAEFAASPMLERMEKVVARLDADGDGAVSLDEAKAMRRHHGRPGHDGPPPAESESLDETR
ncbi:EF hand [Albimonas donghaensis]|uniref:EF hand n=1 Tax=Albimonas donghaensis TaxID=356660 RepID=A0A1H3D065_9RHOB|nr:EF-hand domain-containing protein [Albimonas donghaensis]SDX59781.1 EF hand [Albimonas donghaensis]